MKRRTFLKMAGLGSIAFAAGCSSEDGKRLYSLVRAPDDLVTGKAAWYASVCRECPAGCGIIVKNREGRAIKIEGNPLHPVNRGKLCMRGQAALQGVYHPDRLRSPVVREGRQWRTIGFQEATAILKEKGAAAAQKGPNQVRMVTESVGESLFALFSARLARWQSEAPIIYEPLSYDALSSANQLVFGRSEPAAYRMDATDCLLSFGADFLETWLSPVAYARQFKKMHATHGDKRGLFFHVSPYQSLTAANADKWLCCKPGSEATIALGLIRELLEDGKGGGVFAGFTAAFRETVAIYTPDTVIASSDVKKEDYELLVASVLHSKKPLILGTGAATWTENAPVADIAANVLNLIGDPSLSMFDFKHFYRVAGAASASKIIDFFNRLTQKPPALLLLNRVNPVFTLPPATAVAEAVAQENTYVVGFSDVLDDTMRLADLVIPVHHSLESWDEYSGQAGHWGILQPVMAPLTQGTSLGDLFLNISSPEPPPASDYKAFMTARLRAKGGVSNEHDWRGAIRRGGVFPSSDKKGDPGPAAAPDFHAILRLFATLTVREDEKGLSTEPVFMAAPSIRFFDGRGGNKPWLCEVPDPLTKVAWQTPVMMHPDAVKKNGLAHESVVRITSNWGELSAAVYETEGVHPRAVVMSMGQGHRDYSRYARGIGVNPMSLFSPKPVTGATTFLSAVHPVGIHLTGRSSRLANTDGSRIQHGRKIALYTDKAHDSKAVPDHGEHKAGLTMNDFPLTLPLAEGYSPERDFYPPHAHDGYRWSMVVDLDRCIGCGACAVACYAENNIGVVGEARILAGREMAWLRVERYHDMADPRRIIFLPMMCQHCDNGPCEAVCPVYAPHHSKEGLNNQIYNRCIGTRFCSQNCPYKVRRFNWFDWQWPEPLPNQLNPSVTVRAKGVMEKCSFCIQRIKAAHGVAKDENRKIRDGEVVPACVQTCPTDALTFGNLMDPDSRVRRLVKDSRAYQVMGYLNTKPAVIYLKKVAHV